MHGASRNAPASLAEEKPQHKLLLYGLLGWLVLNLLQAAFTELLHDEAYYWVFSRKLSIVYFDQMPGVAYFIRVGSFLLPGELGVRLMSVLVAPLTLLIYFRLSGTKEAKWFLALAFSMLAIHFNGFFTSPDSVLSFTLALFLLAYRNFLRDPSMRPAIWLLLAAVAVGYSKYQGILFILILALVQYKLWKRPTFWFVLLGFAALLLPIYLTDPETVRVTLNYQLVERGTQDFSILKTLDFLASQLVILGPIAAPLIIWAWIFFRPQDEFLKSLKKATWIYFGILVVMSLKTKVEANWSAPILGCLLVFAACYYSSLQGAWRWIRGVSIVSLVGILLLRVYLVWDFLPPSWTNQMRPETHGWETWAVKVNAVTKGEPIVFWNTYQLPSKFWYYTGRPTTCVSNSSYRKNQFTLMPMERELQGKPVWLAAGFPHTTGGIALPTPGGDSIYLARVPEFYSYPEVRITAEMPKGPLKRGDTLSIPILIRSEDSIGRRYESYPANSVHVGYSWIGEGHINPWGEDTTNLYGRNTQEAIQMVVHPVVPTVPGKYALSIHIVTRNYQLSYNSPRIPVVVE